MSPENYVLVTTAWDLGWVQVHWAKTAILANCSTLPHDLEEIEREDPYNSIIPIIGI